MSSYSATNMTAMFDLLLSDNSNCFMPGDPDAQCDLDAIKADEVALISQTTISADE